MMSKEQFEELVNKLDTLIKLTATSVFQGKPMTESIAFLLDLGLKPKEIATVLRTKPNIVRAIKSQLAKKTKNKRKAKSKSKGKDVKGGEKPGEN